MEDIKGVRQEGKLRKRDEFLSYTKQRGYELLSSWEINLIYNGKTAQASWSDMTNQTAHRFRCLVRDVAAWMWNVYCRARQHSNLCFMWQVNHQDLSTSFLSCEISTHQLHVTIIIWKYFDERGCLCWMSVVLLLHYQTFLHTSFALLTELSYHTLTHTDILTLTLMDSIQNRMLHVLSCL